MLTAKTTAYGTLTIGRTEYVVIPKADYLRMQNIPPGSVDAHAYVRQSIAEALQQAREHAGLTQTELAARLNKSQTMVSQAESGAARVSERYVKAVLKACGLPEDWTGPELRQPKAAPSPSIDLSDVQKKAVRKKKGQGLGRRGQRGDSRTGGGS